jgi:uncharacterized membrane protein YphA (DoxX/SURF4 family)
MSFDLHADHSALQILAHACIAFLFVYRGITAFPDFEDHMETFRSHNVPFPKFMLLCGFATMLLGGLSVLFDFYVWIGAKTTSSKPSISSWNMRCQFISAPR